MRRSRRLRPRFLPRSYAGPGALRALLLVLALAAGSSNGALAQAAYAQDVAVEVPGAEWRSWAAPEEAGFSTEGLEAVRARLGELDTSAMMIVTGGRVVFSYGDVTEVSYLASVRKSILATLYGIHVERGDIDLDRTLAELGIDDVGGLTDAEKQATVRHVVSARSGIFHEAPNAGDDLASAPGRGSQAPGTYQLYSNWDFNAAGTLFEVQTRRNLFDALEAELAVPLGFQDFDRSRHRKGGNMERSIHPSYHMHLSTRDMARFGLLVLRNGRWGDRRIVPEGWVREMTAAVTPVGEMNPERRRDGPHGYGYMWWVWDGPAATGPFQGAFTGIGAVGQYITVLPALDVVIAHKTVPGRDRGVRHSDYLDTVLPLVVAARCQEACAGS